MEICDDDPTIMSFSNVRQYHIECAVQTFCNDGRTTMFDAFEIACQWGCFLLQNYKDDTDFRIRVKKLAALAFIPDADVTPTFESLSAQFLAPAGRASSFGLLRGNMEWNTCRGNTTLDTRLPDPD